VLTVNGSPYGVFLEQTHSLDVVLGVGSKSMVDACRKNKQVTLLNRDADPLIAFATNVKETTSIQDVSNFLVFVEMSISNGKEKKIYKCHPVIQCNMKAREEQHPLVKEALDLGLVNLAHGLRRDHNLNVGIKRNGSV
jgi:hypothetical protein